MSTIDLRCGDALEELKTLPDGSVDLVLTDPPYNIGVQETRAGSKAMAAWDKIENYTDWCIDWLNECSRVLKPNGVLYFWHNDMAQIAELLHETAKKTDLVLVSFCIWDKGDTYRAQSWMRSISCGGDSTGRSETVSKKPVRWENTKRYREMRRLSRLPRSVYLSCCSSSAKAIRRTSFTMIARCRTWIRRIKKKRRYEKWQKVKILWA